MTYQDALAYLDSLTNYEKKSGYGYKKSLKLERMQSLSRRLENPHRGIRAIHISGTKGKGSASSFISSILMEAGFKVGLYTSPHLSSFRERIRVNGEPIGEEEIALLIDRIKPHADEMEKLEGRPTYFEVVTLAAFLYFREKKSDFMVLEVGMGGRLDSTNIARSLVAVITPIGYDHTEHLGATLKDIAFEKCGIIKDNPVTISSPQDPEAMDVISKIAGERNSRLYVVGKDINFEPLAAGLEGQSFRMLTRWTEFPRLEIKLLGDFQIENAATAVAAVEELRSSGIYISSHAVKEGLVKARWPGRLELAQRKPFIVIDGAQNVLSVKALKNAIRDLFRYRRLFLIFGTMVDKDIDGMCGELSDIASCLVATKSRSERACPAEIIRKKMLNCNRDIEVIETASVKEAVKICSQKAGENDMVLITGSLYVAGEAREELKSHPLDFARGRQDTTSPVTS